MVHRVSQVKAALLTGIVNSVVDVKVPESVYHPGIVGAEFGYVLRYALPGILSNA